jgi:hypothetical protein
MRKFMQGRVWLELGEPSCCRIQGEEVWWTAAAASLPCSFLSNFTSTVGTATVSSQNSVLLAAILTFELLEFALDQNMGQEKVRVGKHVKFFLFLLWQQSDLIKLHDSVRSARHWTWSFFIYDLVLR